MRLSKAALAVAFLAFSLPANAITFNWSYTGPGINNGSGTLEATFIVDVNYQITSISGTANGFPITGLADPPNYAFAGSTVYFPAVAQLDVLGFAFKVDTGSGIKAFAIYEDFGILSSVGDPYNCGGVPYCLIGPGDLGTSGLGPPSDPIVGLFSFSAAPIPVPAALPLFAAGLGMLGLVAHRRKRKQAAA